MKRGMIVVVVWFIVASLHIVTMPKSALAADTTIIRIGTHPVGAYVNVVGVAIGKLIGARTPMRAKVMALSGPSAWMPMMAKGEVELGVCGSADGHWGYLGKETYAGVSKGKGFPIRLLLSGLYLEIGPITSKKSGIKSIRDLRGKKVSGDYSNVLSSHYLARAALANAGLDGGTVKIVPVVEPGAGVRALMEGRVDAAGVATTGMPQVRELDAQKGAFFLSLDPSAEAKARTLELFPYCWIDLVKAGAFPGVGVDTWLMRLEVYVLCRADLPDDVVYTIMKAMWDHNSDLMPIHPNFKLWKPENYPSKLLIVPYHEASAKFFKEKGFWTSEMEKSQTELLSMKK